MVALGNVRRIVLCRSSVHLFVDANEMISLRPYGLAERCGGRSRRRPIHLLLPFSLARLLLSTPARLRFGLRASFMRRVRPRRGARGRADQVQHSTAPTAARPRSSAEFTACDDLGFSAPSTEAVTLVLLPFFRSSVLHVLPSALKQHSSWASKKRRLPENRKVVVTSTFPSGWLEVSTPFSFFCSPTVPPRTHRC
jgi:hypothetical protein